MKIERPQALWESDLSDSNTLLRCIGGVSNDALDQPDTCSIEELREDDGNYQPWEAAGIDQTTAVDTAVNMNGESHYVTEV